MDEQFIRNRIAFLRIQKGISEYRMSLDLGHSKSYIQSISSGKALPSLSEFLYICEYLGVTPRDFFDAEIPEPILVSELHTLIREMEREDLLALTAVAKRMQSCQHQTG
ncbi:MAG: helix-turn-helix domain-containing protein [Lachnospiraceae bacterium]|nr:helix-turn-helix domain-containing protein [Lachnospiraceae bacterium]